MECSKNKPEISVQTRNVPSIQPKCSEIKSLASDTYCHMIFSQNRRQQFPSKLSFGGGGLQSKYNETADFFLYTTELQVPSEMI